MSQQLVKEHSFLKTVDFKPHLVKCIACDAVVPCSIIDTHINGAKHGGNMDSWEMLQEMTEEYGDYFQVGAHRHTLICKICDTKSMNYHVLVDHIKGSKHTEALVRAVANTENPRRNNGPPPYRRQQAASATAASSGPRPIDAKNPLKPGPAPNTLICTLCNTKPIHENNIMTHINGEAHKQKIKASAPPTPRPQHIPQQNQNNFHRQPSNRSNNNNAAREEDEIPNVFREGDIPNHFICSLCESGNISRAGIRSHLTGVGHQRHVEDNIIALRVARLCAANKPHLIPWPENLGQLTCSLCSNGAWQPMLLDAALAHLASAAHKERVNALRQQKRRLQFHANNSIRGYGGYGKKPDEEAMKELREQEVVDLPFFDLPAEYAPEEAIGDFPTHADLIVSRRGLVTLATKKISDLSQLVPNEIPQRPIDFNIFTQMARADQPTQNIRNLLQAQLYIEESNETTELKYYSKNNIKIMDAGFNYTITMPGVAENRPSVLRGDKIVIHQDPPHDPQQPAQNNANKAPKGRTYYAYVHHVNVDNIVFSLPQSFINSDAFEYSIVFKVSRAQVRKQHRAVVECDEKAMVFYPKTVGNIGYKSLTQNSFLIGAKKTVEVLNDEQRAFVKHVHGETRVSALWGPPGTGKTTTLVASIVDTILKAPNNTRILVCAPSNEAADLLVERLVQNEEIRHLLKDTFLIRINGLSRDIKSVSEVIRMVSRSSNGRFSFPDVNQVKKYQIVVSTLMTADRLYSIGVGNGHFSHIFIDEAGHATEQLLLVGLNIVGPRCKVVLAGDPKQLGPRVTLPPLAQLNLYQSPLQRLQADTTLWPIVGNQLLQCYRCHPAIVHLINTCYNDMLSTRIPNVNRFAALWQTQLLRSKYLPIHHKNTRTALSNTPPTQPILCLTHTHPESRENDSPSWMNAFELFTLTDIIMELYSNKLVKLSDIAVITPYKKQAQRITDKLYATMMGHPELQRLMITHDPVTKEPLRRYRIPIKVATVDSFQGRESQVVIVSCVRSAMEAAHHDSKFGIGFLKQPERTNVALSRAKDLLIIIGNRNVLCTDETWQEYFRRLDEMDCGVVLNLGGPTLVPAAGIASVVGDDEDVREERAGMQRQAW